MASPSSFVNVTPREFVSYWKTSKPNRRSEFVSVEHTPSSGGAFFIANFILYDGLTVTVSCGIGHTVSAAEMAATQSFFESHPYALRSYLAIQKRDRSKKVEDDSSVTPSGCENND
jgi:hypothetical protein